MTFNEYLIWYGKTSNTRKQMYRNYRITMRHLKWKKSYRYKLYCFFQVLGNRATRFSYKFLYKY